MSFFKRTLTVLAALACVFAAGCSNKGGSSLRSDDASSNAESSLSDHSQADTSGGDESSDSSVPARAEQGDKIKAAAAFFDKDNYEYICKVTGTGVDTTITLIKNAGLCKQTTDHGFCESVILCKGADTYRYDNLTKAYVREVGNVTTDPTGNLITQTVKNDLPATRTHINAEDAKKYDAEEYTYTGGTYITVLDFYFDRATGLLSKYTATFSVEGKDDEVETRQVLRMTEDAGKIDFSENQLRHNYTDLNALNETEREQFCKELMQRLGITDEDMYSAGLTPFDLKKITYTELSEFVISFKTQQALQK